MSSPARKLSVTMPVAGVHHCPGDFATVCCAGCDRHLGLSQPESDEPYRLIGTCEECGRWYLLDWHPGSREGVMVLLPGHEDLLRIFRASGMTGPCPEGRDGDGPSVTG